VSETRSDDDKQSGATLVAFEDDDGDQRSFPGDKLGPFFQLRQAPDKFSSTTAAGGEVSHSVEAQVGDPAPVFLEALAYNGSGAKAYLMVFDLAAAALAPGLVPAFAAVAVAADASVAVEVDERGLKFPGGITVALSTTPLVYAPIAGGSSYTIVYR
jgi:hypothetical protein